MLVMQAPSDTHNNNNNLGLTTAAKILVEQTTLGHSDYEIHLQMTDVSAD